MKVMCPHCDSTSIQSVDTVQVTNIVTSWSLDHDGELVPQDFAGGDVDWNTTQSANPDQPYECRRCFKPLALDDLIVLKEPK